MKSVLAQKIAETKGKRIEASVKLDIPFTRKDL
jgi:hypothetical protein